MVLGCPTSSNAKSRSSSNAKSRPLTLDRNGPECLPNFPSPTVCLTSKPGYACSLSEVPHK